MYRNRDGKLIFQNAAEEKAYNDKKNLFLSRTEEENVRIFQTEVNKMLGLEETVPTIAAIPSKPEVVIDPNLTIIETKVEELEERLNTLMKALI